MSVNILLSYAYHSQTDLAEVRKKLVCGRLMIDSGAFTAHNTGREVTVQGYADYLNSMKPHWDHAVTLDVIGDPIASRKNTLKLHAMGVPVMPVFTRGESLAEFDAMVKDSGYVCIGGSGGMSQDALVKRIAMLQRRAADLGGGVHALGLGSTRANLKAVPYSADASTIAGAFRFGIVQIFDGQTVRPVGVRKRDVMKKHMGSLMAHGIDAGALLRLGRLPTSKDVVDGVSREQLMQAMSLAYAACDEYLRTRGTAPVPHKTDDVPGTHLYSAIPNMGYLKPAMELDWRLHYDPTFKPRIWSQYGRKHVCHHKHPAGRKAA